MPLPRRERRALHKTGDWQFAMPVIAIRAAIVLLLLHPVMTFFSRRRTFGLEWLASLEGPVIFAANHLSVVDNPAILLALPWKCA